MNILPFDAVAAAAVAASARALNDAAGRELGPTGTTRGLPSIPVSSRLLWAPSLVSFRGILELRRLGVETAGSGGPLVPFSRFNGTLSKGSTFSPPLLVYGELCRGSWKLSSLRFFSLNWAKISGTGTDSGMGSGAGSGAGSDRSVLTREE